MWFQDRRRLALAAMIAIATLTAAIFVQGYLEEKHLAPGLSDLLGALFLPGLLAAMAFPAGIHDVSPLAFLVLAPIVTATFWTAVLYELLALRPSQARDRQQ